MGQYFKFINFDKKEMLSLYDYDNLAKVMEHSYQGNKFMYAAETLIKNRWKGDRVLYIGDYVDEYYEDTKVKDTLVELLKETNPPKNNLYWLEYSPAQLNLTNNDFTPTRFIYNHKTKEYIDLKTQPIQWSGFDKSDNCIYGTKIHPLSILLCASNGSGGSYYGTNMEYVGSWVNSIGKIEISDTPISYNYTELNITFDEAKTGKDNIEILKETIKDNIFKNRISNIEELKFDSSLFLDETEKFELYDLAKKYKKEQMDKLLEDNKYTTEPEPELEKDI